MNVSYMEEAEEDQELLLTAKVLKCGKDLAFVQVDFANLGECVCVCVSVPPLLCWER